jgi:hypothetical protein
MTGLAQPLPIAFIPECLLIAAMRHNVIEVSGHNHLACPLTVNAQRMF